MRGMWLALILSWLTSRYTATALVHPPAAIRRLSVDGSGSKTKLYFFDKLAQSLSSISETLQGKRRLTAKNIGSALKDVKKALIDADVNVRVANGLIDSVRERSLGSEAIEGVEPSQQFIKAMYDELVRTMGGEELSGDVSSRRFLLKGNVILLCGLQGAGKTTAAAKLAYYLTAQEKKKTLLVAADVYRPAAVDQLKILGEKIGVPVYSVPNSTDPVAIAREARSKAENFDAVIIDTAGRQIIDDELMIELEGIKRVVRPDETLLVLDAMTGQDAAKLCVAFNKACPLTGSILTKLDGDARGGAALSVKAVSGVPIKFVGVGEKAEDLEPFYPARMASRILGMGDVVSFVEKAQRTVSDQQAREQMARLTRGAFDFDDYLAQCETLATMGNFAGVAKMMPGMSGVDSAQIQAAEVRAKTAKAMILSMTPKERKQPDLLIRDSTSLSRLKRLGTGAGFDIIRAQTFIAEFQAMRTMMSKMANQQQQQQPGSRTQGAASPSAGNRAARRASGRRKGKTKARGPRGFN